MKKILKRLVPMLVMIALLSIQVSATTASKVSPRYTGIYTFAVGCDVTTSGRTDNYGRVELRDGYTADMTLTLQRSSDGVTWYEVKSWETTGEDIVVLDKSYYVSSGYNYRAKCVVEIYDENGTFVESDTLRSNSKYY